MAADFSLTNIPISADILLMNTMEDASRIECIQAVHEAPIKESGPKISIIIPTFNSERVIGRCLNNILRQTYKNYEIIIADGASVDWTLSIINDYMAEYKAIKLLSKLDSGIYDAMNSGVTLATGDWCYFIGSDDEFYDNNVLSTFSSLAESTDADMIYGNAQVVGDVSWAKDGTIYDGHFDFEKITKKNICHQAIFYRLDSLRRIGPYNVKYRICADWDMNLRFWAYGQCKFVDFIVAKFNSGGATTNSGDPVFRSDFLKLKEQYFGL
jgi:glycosyltransferase involved in cell wall biosynthesis